MILKSSLILVIVAVLITALMKLWVALPTGKEGVQFYYQTSYTSRQKITSLESVPNLDNSNITLIIHGLLQTSQAEWIQNLTRAILNRETESKHVIFLVDYWDMHVLTRPRMLENGIDTARKTAHMLNYLVLHKQLDLARCHLIGYSFGGMISGMISHYIEKGKIGRLTGLDPAHPYKISTYDTKYFIDESDAKIVTTIRTSVVSSKIPQASIDFYPNGGLIQPGCYKWYVPTLFQNLCSHRRSTLLLVEAFENTDLSTLEACSCDDYESYINKSCQCKMKNNFGTSINPRLTGKFFLSINDNRPFLRLKPTD